MGLIVGEAMLHITIAPFGPTQQPAPWDLQPALCLSLFVLCWVFPQMMSDTGHPDLVTAYTDASWRLVRKGVAPAFSPHNIRSPTLRLSDNDLVITCHYNCHNALFSCCCRDYHIFLTPKRQCVTPHISSAN